MTEHHYPWRHLVQHGGDCFGVFRTSPHCLGRGGTSEPGQVKRDRVDSRRRENGFEVPVVPPPSVQSENPWRARAVRLPEQA
jgi:hypothetical protein